MRRQQQLSLFPALIANDNTAQPLAAASSTPSGRIGLDPERVRRSAILAIQERRVCRVAYAADGGAARTREFEPYAITRVDDHWSIFGYCRLRGDLRTFRSDRIVSFEVLDASFVPRASVSLERFILRRRGVA